MKRQSIHTIYFLLGFSLCLLSAPAIGQVVINELVEDEQDFDSTNDIAPDTREFVELYNAGNSPVNIENWSIGTIQLSTGLPYASFTIPTRKVSRTLATQVTATYNGRSASTLLTVTR
jgi:hypothetical protein